MRGAELVTSLALAWWICRDAWAWEGRAGREGKVWSRGRC